RVVTPGSRTHRGLHSVARCAGSCPFSCSYPPVRGLTGGYVLSPAARARVLSRVVTPGSWTHRGLHSVARCAGSCPFSCSSPRFADSPGATFCRPLRGLMLAVRRCEVVWSPTRCFLISNWTRHQRSTFYYSPLTIYYLRDENQLQLAG